MAKVRRQIEAAQIVLNPFNRSIIDFIH